MSGSVTLGGGSSGTAVTLDNTYVSSHLAMFQAMTAEIASSGPGLYTLSGSATLLLAPDNLGPIATFGTAGSTAVVVGDGDTLDYVGGVGSATVAAGNGNDVAIAGSGSDVIALGTGNNQIFLGSGQSTVVSAGTDTIQAGTGDAMVSVTGSNSVIYAANGGALSVDDTSGSGTTVYGASGTTIDATTVSGATTTVASFGDATVVGGTGGVSVAQAYGSLTVLGDGGQTGIVQGPEASPDALYARNDATVALVGSTHNNIFVANDAVRGDGGSVVLDGENASGGNQFWAGSGNATLLGGTGNDTLVAGTGSATMRGGGGADQFDFFSVQGGSATNVTIADFGGSDVMNLFGYGSAGLQYALAHTVQDGTSTMLSLSDGSTITLQQYNHADLAGMIKTT